jgi:hypothetical protein
VNDHHSPDEIRRRMEQVRTRMQVDATSTKATARQMTDWRYYVRRFPWAAVGGACLLGFVLVPKRLPQTQQVIDEDALRRLAKEQRIVITPQPSEPVQKGLAGTLLALAATGLSRAAMSYVASRINRP